MKAQKDTTINKKNNATIHQDLIILDLSSAILKENQDFNIDIPKLDNLLEILKQSGSFWLIAGHARLCDRLQPKGFEIAEYIINQGMFLRNIIVWFMPNDKTFAERLTNRYVHIYFFVKDPHSYYFNKDLIREKHIWKDVEWGKRSGRYNPLGKDPGNVWLMTEDDGKGNKTSHIPLSFDTVIERIKKATFPKNGKMRLYTNRIVISKNCTYPAKDFIKSHNVKKQITKITSTEKKPVNKELRYKIFKRTSEKMVDLRDREVDLIVTSPPYWNMKDYNIKNQIGHSESYELYLARIKKVWQECFRVLSKKGTFWLNVNTKIHNKSLQMIQYDFYKQCVDIGFKLWDIVIWHKSVSGPAPDNNLTDKFEYVLLFYKAPGFYFNLPYEKTDSDYLIPFLKNMGNVWNINRFWGSIGKNYPHPAMYPNELIERILNLGSVKNDLILDPFLGSGTTLVVAKRLGRACIGYEINSDFFTILNRKLEEDNIDTLFNQGQKVQYVR